MVEDNGKIIAYLRGTLDATYENYKQHNYADLVALYVHPDYQGLGIGTKLKNLFINWLKTKGINKFIVGVLKDNRKARIVYEKWGGN